MTRRRFPWGTRRTIWLRRDRKSTRLNSSHLGISYAVFCLKKNNSNSVDFLSGAAYVLKPPIDALAEFKLQTNFFSAEFGRAGGAVLNSSFFFNDTATTEIYTLSLHDALPI